MVQRGRYVATVDVPWLAKAIASPALVKQKLEEKGFSNVSVLESPPPGWPLGPADDYYVAVSWQNPPQVFKVPGAVTAYRKVA